MSAKRRNIVGDTPYQIQLRQMILMVKAGGLKDINGEVSYSFTPAWLAQQFGRKVTADFRKAMNKFEQEGLIEAYYYPSQAAGGTGICKAFTTQISTQTGGVDPYVNWEKTK